MADLDQDKQCPAIVEDIDAAWRFCGEITKFVLIIVGTLVCFAILAAVASIWGTR
jgi:hypothetical protein